MLNLLVIIFVCFFCSLSIRAEASVEEKYAGYNENYARFLLSFTSGAYSMTPKECIESTSRMYKKEYKLLKKQVNATCDGKGNSCAFYASVSPSTCEMIIIFRGTTTKSQLLQEGILGMKPNMEFFGHGTVNRYFFNALEAMWEEIKGALEDSRYRSCKTTFTGHSLGGALASAAALRTVIEGLRKSEQVQLYTFGQPRTGNYKFAMEHDRLVPVSFRVVNGADMVPHVPLCRFSDKDAPSDANTMQDENTAPIPPEQLSDSDDEDSGDFSLVDVVKSRPCKAGQTRKAYHHGTEVWYPDGMTGSSFCFVVCQGHPKNEDHACSNGVHLNSGWQTWRRYVKNHIIYFGQHVSKYGQNKCQPLMGSETTGTSICRALLKNPPPVWKPPTVHDLDDEDNVIAPGNSPSKQGSTGESEEECKNLSSVCNKALDMCGNEAYRLLMLVKCPQKCGMCEDHKHLPTSKNKCKNSSLTCFTSIRMAKCATDAKVRAECPWSCGTCT